MILEYFNNMREDYLQQKMTLLNQIHACENQIKEHEKMIHMMEESSDPNYEAFTPRRVNSFQKEKLDELKNTLKSSNDTLASLKTQLDELEGKIQELSEMLQFHKENYILKSDYQDVISNLKSLVQKSELCCQLISVDDSKCKQELLLLNNGLKDVLDF